MSMIGDIAKEAMNNDVQKHLDEKIAKETDDGKKNLLIELKEEIDLISKYW